MTGDSLALLAWIGVAMALVAIAMVSYSNDGPVEQISRQVIVESLVAGTFFVFLDATEAVNAPWPVVGARLVTTTTIIAVLLATRRELVPKAKAAVGMIALTGVLDTGSNVTFLYATNSGSLTIVAVLSSLYPIATVILARLVLSERITQVQLAGFVTALVATAFIAAG